MVSIFGTILVKQLMKMHGVNNNCGNLYTLLQNNKLPFSELGYSKYCTPFCNILFDASFCSLLKLTLYIRSTDCFI
jgi:hypothetical protein